MEEMASTEYRVPSTDYIAPSLEIVSDESTPYRSRTWGLGGNEADDLCTGTQYMYIPCTFQQTQYTVSYTRVTSTVDGFEPPFKPGIFRF